MLHVDTLVGEGPAAHDPGELRGLSSSVSIDAESAAELARDEIGAGAATCVLLTDGQGAVQRLVRLATAPAEGWTRAALVAAVRQALPRLPAVQADGYAPTVHITEHVRARNPRCTAYDCARVARRCDLDHDEPWPRGPTAVHNLDPRCRRDHELKTRGLLRTRLAPDGSVTTTMLTGLAVTTRPEPLPGFGPGEGYARATA
ncbi:MAG: HNH endonuclease signature motif containing protein [Actinomycetes bacterium]